MKVLANELLERFVAYIKLLVIIEWPLFPSKDKFDDSKEKWENGKPRVRPSTEFFQLKFCNVCYHIMVA